MKKFLIVIYCIFFMYQPCVAQTQADVDPSSWAAARRGWHEILNRCTSHRCEEQIQADFNWVSKRFLSVLQEVLLTIEGVGGWSFGFRSYQDLYSRWREIGIAHEPQS